ncbi:hypothetical protein [Porphyromonas gulae]|uniref:hypothetical protein n=1 Tax=Porphyromonas gulae TaxID=111105 RepID=UPI0003A3AC1C|nr:hypothetical protein [Porphyromonas gulae]
MTEQSERPYNGTYYTLEDKHFWAAFLNLARHKPTSPSHISTDSSPTARPI